MIGTPIENAAISHPVVAANENPQDSRLAGTWYEIRVRGQLDPSWSDWFGGLKFKPLADGQMLLSGRILDQAALVGVLTRLNRLNLALISVRSVEE